MFSPSSRSRDDLMAPHGLPVAARFPGTEELCRESAARGPASAESLAPALSTPESTYAYGELTLAAAVRPHLPMLRRVAKRILLCPEQAEDAVQDALIVLWERADRPVELKGWLVKTVIHRSLHRRRTEMRRRRWEEEASIAAEVTCPLCDPEEEFARREFLTVVEAAIAGLSSRYRVVVELRSRGLEYDEIANHLGLPIGTVRSRLNRARGILKKQLSPDGL